jgi:hypothetical protein
MISGTLIFINFLYGYPQYASSSYFPDSRFRGNDSTGCRAFKTSHSRESGNPSLLFFYKNVQVELSN